MQKQQSKLTSQGQVSVPVQLQVREYLHLSPGSVLLWTQLDGRIVVERAKRHSTAEVHQALFPAGMVGGELRAQVVSRQTSTRVFGLPGVRDRAQGRALAVGKL